MVDFTVTHMTATSHDGQTVHTLWNPNLDDESLRVHFSGEACPFCRAERAESALAASRAQVAALTAGLREIESMFESESWQCPRCGHAEETKDCNAHYVVRDLLSSPPIAAYARLIEETHEVLRTYEGMTNESLAVLCKRSAGRTKAHYGFVVAARAAGLGGTNASE